MNDPRTFHNTSEAVEQLTQAARESQKTTRLTTMDNPRTTTKEMKQLTMTASKRQKLLG